MASFPGFSRRNLTALLQRVDFDDPKTFEKINAWSKSNVENGNENISLSQGKPNATTRILALDY